MKSWHQLGLAWTSRRVTVQAGDHPCPQYHRYDSQKQQCVLRHPGIYVITWVACCLFILNLVTLYHFQSAISTQWYRKWRWYNLVVSLWAVAAMSHSSEKVIPDSYFYTLVGLVMVGLTAWSVWFWEILLCRRPLPTTTPVVESPAEVTVYVKEATG